MFDGQKRGICGEATRTSSLKQTELFSRLIAHRGLNLPLIGVGGAATAEHVRAYLNAGAEQIHLASAAMADPGVAISIKQAWAECESKEMV
jgi:dihydroorotate dehydrogenase